MPFSSEVLDGRVAVMIGAGSGIGRAALTAYLDAGARVLVMDVSPDKCAEVSALGREVAAQVGDATRYADVRAAMDAAAGKFGKIDVVVSFVGVFDNYTTLEQIAEDDLDAAFDEIFAINVKSSLFMVHAAMPHLRDRGGSVILTLSSSSFYAGRGGILYVTSKFALRGMVVQLAHELAPMVRVNAVAPGGTVRTDLRGMAVLGQADQRLDDRPGRREQLEARTPLRVALTPEHHAPFYVFLASDGARSMTGEILRSDGGLGAR